jgi:membrane protease YdiL (CAAX protease family)
VNVFQLGTYYVSLHYAQIWNEVPPHLLQWFLAFLALVFFRVKRVTAAQLGVQKKGAIRWVLLGAGVGLVNYGVYHALSIVLASGVDIEIARVPTSVSGHAFYLFVAVLAGPVVEELLYRGIVYPPYRNRYNPMVAIAIVSALFSLGHFELSIDATLVALCWGALYELTESIVAPVAAHSTYNLLWVVTEFLQR